MFTPRDREYSAEILRALAHPIRLGVLERLAEGDRTVSELFADLRCSQSVMSQQLRILKSQGLITMTRQGTTKICSLRNRDFLRLFDCLRNHLDCYLTGVQRPK